jgi:hypothetical protein
LVNTFRKAQHMFSLNKLGDKYRSELENFKNEKQLQICKQIQDFSKNSDSV